MSDKTKPINRVKVKINGEDYYIKGTVSEEYIKQVAQYVDKTINELEKKYSNLSRTRMAVLAALNITDELFRLKQEHDEFLATFGSDAKD
ncbi:MAG: cell division protein ZapA [Thermoanaerobacteraceae bacterium]|nr:cell division protein ZapA [Thermoanaerobacteraceae bacterium]